MDSVAQARHIYFYVCKMVSRYIALDISRTGVTLALILMIIQIMDEGVLVAWGYFLLAKLYRDLH